MAKKPDREVVRLYSAWTNAVREYRAVEPYSYDEQDKWVVIEQDAYDALVDYIESNNMNGCYFDPRGPIGDTE